MKRMQILPYVCAILFPYFAVIGIIYFAFIESFMFVVHGLISFVTAVILCVWCSKSAVTGTSNKKSVVMNLVTKIYYMIPFYMLLISRFFGGNTSLQRLLDSDLRYVFITAFLTGFCNIGNCIRLYRNGNCKRFTEVILCLMGFVWGLDIIGGIIQLITSFKKEAD